MSSALCPVESLTHYVSALLATPPVGAASAASLFPAAKQPPQVRPQLRPGARLLANPCCCPALLPCQPLHATQTRFDAREHVDSAALPLR